MWISDTSGHGHGDNNGDNSGDNSGDKSGDKSGEKCVLIKGGVEYLQRYMLYNTLVLIYIILGL